MMCAFSDLSVLAKSRLLSSGLIYVATREIFFFILFSGEGSNVFCTFHIILEGFGELPAVDSKQAEATLTSRSHCAAPLSL